MICSSADSPSGRPLQSLARFAQLHASLPEQTHFTHCTPNPYNDSLLVLGKLGPSLILRQIGHRTSWRPGKLGTRNRSPANRAPANRAPANRAPGKSGPGRLDPLAANWAPADWAPRRQIGPLEILLRQIGPLDNLDVANCICRIQIYTYWGKYASWYWIYSANNWGIHIC